MDVTRGQCCTMKHYLEWGAYLIETFVRFTRASRLGTHTQKRRSQILRKSRLMPLRVERINRAIFPVCGCCCLVFDRADSSYKVGSVLTLMVLDKVALVKVHGIHWSRNWLVITDSLSAHTQTQSQITHTETCGLFLVCNWFPMSVESGPFVELMLRGNAHMNSSCS